jgi:hypothetical protein
MCPGVGPSCARPAVLGRSFKRKRHKKFIKLPLERKQFWTGHNTRVITVLRELANYVRLLSYILEVPGSKLSRETDCHT